MFPSITAHLPTSGPTSGAGNDQKQAPAAARVLAGPSSSAKDARQNFTPKLRPRNVLRSSLLQKHFQEQQQQREEVTRLPSINSNAHPNQITALGSVHGDSSRADGGLMDHETATATAHGKRRGAGVGGGGGGGVVRRRISTTATRGADSGKTVPESCRLLRVDSGASAVADDGSAGTVSLPPIMKRIMEKAAAARHLRTSNGERCTSSSDKKTPRTGCGSGGPGGYGGDVENWSQRSTVTTANNNLNSPYHSSSRSTSRTTTTATAYSNTSSAYRRRRSNRRRATRNASVVSVQQQKLQQQQEQQQNPQQLQKQGSSAQMATIHEGRLQPRSSRANGNSNGGVGGSDSGNVRLLTPHALSLSIAGLESLSSVHHHPQHIHPNRLTTAAAAAAASDPQAQVFRRGGSNSKSHLPHTQVGLFPAIQIKDPDAAAKQLSEEDTLGGLMIESTGANKI